MNKWSALFLLGVVVLCDGKEPFKPRDGILPFMVYFQSHYRGICVGFLVSRTAALTAAVCVTHPLTESRETMPIDVVAGATYRHPRRGIRVQVTKIILPKWSNSIANRGYLMQKSPAMLLLKQQIPDLLTQVPLRGIEIDHKGELKLHLHEECFMAGYHFFYKGDKVRDGKFLLQRNLRIQFLQIVKKHLWCDKIMHNFQEGIGQFGFSGYSDKESSICIRDVDRIAQPCHGMYGAPLICQGKVVAMLMAPDAQWKNCTGYSNLVHLLNSEHLRGFMNCVSSLFSPEFHLEGDTMKKFIYDDLNEEYDYLPDMYDKVLSGSSSTEEE